MIVNIFNWQDDSGDHVTEVKGPDSAEAFRVSYKPVAVGNRLWIQVNGTAGSGTGAPPNAGKRNWLIYMAASFDGGKTWIPPDWASRDKDAMFMATSVISAWQAPENFVAERSEVYLLTGEIEAASAEMILRVMVASGAGNCPDARINNGSMVHIMEYEG